VRIVIGASHRGLIGGVEKYLQWLMPALIERGHSVGLLYEYPFHATPESAGQQIDSRAAHAPAWCSRELGLDGLLQSLRMWAPDVIYSNGFDDNELERSLLDSYPAALYAHTYYGTCVSGRKCHAWPRLEPCDRQLGPACLALYYPRRCGGLNPRTMWELFELQSKRQSVLAEYQAVLVASRHMYREYEKHGVAKDRLHLVPLPTGDSVPDAEPPRPRPLRDRVLFIGRLMDVKGASYLLRAIQLAAEKLGRAVSLTIAGDGPERTTLEDQARRLGQDVKFVGWVDSLRRSELIREADLVAVPSLWPEPFGLVGIEAGCLGVPAVGFAVGGITDWLIPGQSGELAPAAPPTAEGLSDAIRRALADPVHHQKLRIGAWEVARQFTFQRHLSLLEGVLSAASARHEIPQTA
jgi:glycosyltransferase involved in cell wall biosynthesis